MLNECISVHYTQQGKELIAARNRLLDALNGIPVQFRSKDLQSAMDAMSATRATRATRATSTAESTADEVEAIKAHSQWLLDVIDRTPQTNITNKADDAAKHFRNCLQAFQEA
jgi:hypothetical protein